MYSLAVSLRKQIERAENNFKVAKLELEKIKSPGAMEESRSMDIPLMHEILATIDEARVAGDYQKVLSSLLSFEVIYQRALQSIIFVKKIEELSSDSEKLLKEICLAHFKLFDILDNKVIGPLLKDFINKLVDSANDPNVWVIDKIRISVVINQLQNQIKKWSD